MPTLPPKLFWAGRSMDSGPQAPAICGWDFKAGRISAARLLCPPFRLKPLIACATQRDGRPSKARA